MNTLGGLVLLTLGGARAAPSGAEASAFGELPAGVLHFPLTRSGPEHWESFLHRRADELSLNLNNLQTLFTTELKIGSNGQTVSVQVDTGSSDLWVMESDNPYCKSIQNGTSSSPGPSGGNVDPNDQVVCQASAMFDPSQSTSYGKNSTSFSIRYGDGSFANGTYGHDDITFAGATVQQANFAVANVANSTTAVWGIGYEATEAIVRTVDQNGVYSPTYLNLPAQMKQQGLIKANAYSLWLNDVDANRGSLLFGGVDHTKYTGTLQTVPVISTYQGISNPSELRVMLHAMSLYQGSNSANLVQCSLPFLLDSGTSFMLLPEQFLAPLIDSIGAVYSKEGIILVPCDLDGGLGFDLSGIQIQVPFSEIQLGNTGVPGVCALGIMDGGDSSLILGDTFLRSVYAVYDLDNNEVALAKPVYNVSSSSIDVIDTAIPSATQAPSYSSTQLLNSIVTARATFFSVPGSSQSFGASGSNPRAGAGLTSQASDGGFGTFTTTLFSETNSFTGLTSQSMQPTAVLSSTASSSLDTARKNGAPQVERQSLLGAAAAGIFGLILYL